MFRTTCKRGKPALFGALILLFCFIPTLLCAAQTRNVRVGYFDFPGYHDIDESGNRSGYGYEYLHEMAKTSGWSFTYVSGTWEECQEMLKNGDIDLLTSAQRTPQREEYFDFSALPMGESYGQLSVRSDNQSYTRNDYAGFNGMKVGILKGNSRNALLQELAIDKGFTYREVPFADADALTNALQSNQVDAIVTSSLRKPVNERVIAQFATSPFYCIVKKGNEPLLAQVNAALENIEINNPAYKFNLYDKYYRSGITQEFSLSKQEADYLSQKQTVRVVGNPNNFPLFYVEDGEAKGITADVLSLVLDDLNVDIEYVFADTYEHAIKMVRDGQAELINMLEADYNWAENNGLKITSPYTAINYSMITRAQTDRDFSKIALVSNKFINQKYILPTFSDATFIQVKTELDAARAVAAKKADAAIINTYSAQAILFSEFPNLKATFIDGQTTDLALGVGKSVSPILYTILDRKVSSLDKLSVSKIIANYTMLYDTDMTIMQYARQNPIQSILAIGGIFLAVIAAVLYWAMTKKRHADRVFTLAFCDSMTGLWNSNGFTREVTRRLTKQTAQTSHAIVILDIEGFATVNTNYGRDAGDTIITEIAKQIKRFCGEEAVVAHSHADNFLLWVHYTTKQELDILLSGISSFMQGFALDTLLVKLNLRMGIYQTDAADETAFFCALDFAQIAHQVARRQAKALQFFDEALQQRLQREKNIIDHFDDALKAGELMAFFQPKYDMRTNSISGAEALIRWEHKDLGFLTPNEFLPLLEGTGDVIEIDFFVLEEVCKLIRAWIDTGHKTIPISVNQSRANFLKPDYMNRLQNLLIQYDIPRDVIELEITETLFESQSISPEIIKKMKMLGFSISVDDFGSGYSSLYLLNQVSVDVLKIDKSLIDDSESKIKVRKIVSKIVEMAYDLGLEVICEGVENQEQVDFLLEIGCKYAQGFFYSRPLAKEAFLTSVK